MAEKYYITKVFRYNHYRDDFNSPRYRVESFELKHESLEALKEELLSLIKSETEPDKYGEYVTYKWSEVTHIQGLGTIVVTREDIPGSEEAKDAKLYKELMVKYPNGIPGAS